jgi:glucose 1-dehydrogenase
MELDLANKRVLITGGNSGIGAATARLFAESGAHVVINYLEHPETADVLVRDHHVALAIRADVSDEAAVEAMFRQIEETLGGLDVLFNNAGCESIHAAMDIDMHAWDQVMNVNLRGAFMCARAAGRIMRRQGTGGVIINNTSIHGLIPRKGVAHYSASKAGLAMLTRALALEWAEFGIRVITVSPGAIETDMNRERIARRGRALTESWIPLRRLGQAEDVARTVAFLASDAASYISGIDVAVDGAYSLNLVRHDSRDEV